MAKPSSSLHLSLFLCLSIPAPASHWSTIPISVSLNQLSNQCTVYCCVFIKSVFSALERKGTRILEKIDCVLLNEFGKSLTTLRSRSYVKKEKWSNYGFPIRADEVMGLEESSKQKPVWLLFSLCSRCGLMLSLLLFLLHPGRDQGLALWDTLAEVPHCVWASFIEYMWMSDHSKSRESLNLISQWGDGGG